MSKHEIPIKCLIIDDEISYANVLAKRMRLRGIEATPVYGGREAIQLLKKESFHVALLDLKMDDMDGIEVLKMFRIIEPMMRVVILTGHGGKAEA
ncbi:MAG: response regulator, partial [Desulfovibrionaceae bacterium]|nr:response regulator [Desulfovibrionaceae bacterium]